MTTPTPTPPPDDLARPERVSERQKEPSGLEVLAPAVEDTSGVAFTGVCSSIHGYFGLSYASYLVLPRTVLQSMPDEWQARFVAMLAEIESTVGDYPDSYEVRLRDESGRYVHDNLADYQRGRRRLTQ